MSLPKREEEILEFWQKENIFQKSLDKESPKGEFVFFDGPPFASGLPHYGHMLPGTIKDVIPRFRTMQGYHVPRQWGWDCHGLPVENLVEKELGLKAKRDIERYGIKEFNEAARAHIMKDDAEWRRIIPRTGRWADMDLDYKTMDPTYTESVWWAFKSLYGKGLIYEGFKSLHYCPHCGTTLSNFEVAQGYKDIEDFAVTVKFPLVDEPDTSLLIWTTTPWTLPGNAAVAVNPDFTYDKVKVEDSCVIAAEGKIEGEVIKKYKGKELVGKKYAPPFEYFIKTAKVHAADFVTAEDGTGIVHIAPAFGADDLALSRKEKIQLIQHVDDEGKFKPEVKDFTGLVVKPKGNPKETDAKIVEHLKQKGLLFKEEKIKHAYPHCWRCDTPLLNWAANSWFVNVQRVKGKLLSENAKVRWVPEHVGRGRFANGLESAPDWAISRSRFWGAPIPVWRHSKTKEVRVAGSVNDLLSMIRRSGNRYFVMRHGEAMHNVQHMLDPNGDPNNHLTDKGKNEVVHAANDFKKENIDLVILSPFLRTRETAGILQKELGLNESALMVDERLHEYNEGDVGLVRKRVGELLFEVERRYTNKNIIFVTHGNPVWVLQQIAMRSNDNNFRSELMLHTGEVRELLFVPYPHNDNYELDLHRPYIDEVPMGNTIEGEWKRVPDVFDCWFESGSMPFASNHYPFEKDAFNPKRLFGLSPKGYPADFIAEGLDQTRGWFYSLIVLGAALFGKSPYKAVVVNGLVLASDGQKMSKRLKNYPDLMEVIDKYGADSLRYFLMSSPAVRAEDLRFNERGIEEVSKKLLMRLDNVRSFYELYANETLASAESANILDAWILSRLNELIVQTTEGYERYELDTATRPLVDFIDDLSTWYVRRSRDRLKDKEPQALVTLRHVLVTTAKVMAPVMPFFAEHLYLAMREESDPQSVHLCDWPAGGAVDAELLQEMKKVREASSEGLRLREVAGIKVRQPLAKFFTTLQLSDWGSEIVKDEVNVKEVEKADTASLDTAITPELREEGVVRNLIRQIQDWRKEQKFTISDRPTYELQLSGEEKEIAERNRETLIQETNLENLTIVDAQDTHQ